MCCNHRRSPLCIDWCFCSRRPNTEWWDHVVMKRGVTENPSQGICSPCCLELSTELMYFICAEKKMAFLRYPENTCVCIFLLEWAHEYFNYKGLGFRLTTKASSWTPAWTVSARQMKLKRAGTSTFWQERTFLSPSNMVVNRLSVPPVILGDCIYSLLSGLTSEHLAAKGLIT